jgi:hypothetical protein
VDRVEPGSSTRTRVKRERTGDVEFLSHKRLRATVSAASEILILLMTDADVILSRAGCSFAGRISNEDTQHYSTLLI